MKDYLSRIYILTVNSRQFIFLIYADKGAFVLQLQLSIIFKRKSDLLSDINQRFHAYVLPFVKEATPPAGHI